MNVYVIGAGVSKEVGYPLGAEIFNEIDAYVRGLSPDRYPPSNFLRTWRQLCEWLEISPNPMIAEAYRARNLEGLSTVLDHAFQLFLQAGAEMAVAQRVGKPPDFITVDAIHKTYFMSTMEYLEAQRVLKWALGAYLEHKHQGDAHVSQGPAWENLRRFARRLRPGDVVITFNYDSTIERVLYEEGLWTPYDGYGFTTSLQKSRSDFTPASYGHSPIITLHLHGAVGWHDKGFADHLDDDQLTNLSQELAHEIIEEPVTLGEDFMIELGVAAFDPRASRGDLEFHIILHPSYLKPFGTRPRDWIFVHLWRKAAEALRSAERIFIIGYSLPEADSAALALLITNCDQGKVEIVNSSGLDARRLHRLLKSEWSNDRAESFHDWLTSVRDDLY